jgi:transcriptional regulator GlxA family with amidase domain
MSYALNAIVDQLSKEVRANPHVTLKEVCQRLNVERHSVERAFRQKTGHSFREMRRDALLDLARDLPTSQPHLSVKEIAARAGYQSAQAFARSFKKSTGIAPHEFRKPKMEPSSNRLT